jgi:hypothetical protein
MARVLVREKCFIGYSKLFQDGYESFAQLKQCAARAFFDDAARRTAKMPLFICITIIDNGMKAETLF